MTFLPLVDRELRIRARMPSTFRMRLGAALLAILLSIMMLLAGELWFAPRNVGAFLFYALGIVAFVYCLLEGIRTTSDALSEEKRSGTLGLLFLTDLKGYDVVLGKLMATSLNSFYCLLAIFPSLAIPIVLGGITGGEFWRLVLMLTNTLVFSLALGLFVSSLSYHDRKAGMATLLLLLGFTLLPPLIPGFLGGGNLFGLTCSPLIAFYSLPDGSYAANPDAYWNAMLGIHLASWAFVGLASFLLPRNWQETGAAPRGRKARHPIPGSRASSSTGMSTRHRPLLDVHPTMWLAHRRLGSSKPLWMLVLGAGLIGLLMEWLLNNPTGLFIIALILHFILAVWAASDACHALNESRNSGALELLLSTPLRPAEIIRGYQQALFQKFSRPVLALIIIESTVLVSRTTVMGIEEEDPLAGLLVAGFVGLTLGVSILDILAASRFGLWMGMTNKNSIRATVKTVGYALVLPLGLCVLSLCCGVLWPVVGLVKNILFINISQDRLQRNFRRLVTEQYLGTDIPSVPPQTYLEKRRAERELPSVLPPDGKV